MISSNTESLKRVKSSSIQLMSAVDALETRQDSITEDMRKELAKLEFTISKTAAEKEIELGDSVVMQDTMAALRSDLRATSHKVDLLSLKLASVEEYHLEKDAKTALRHSKSKNRKVHVRKTKKDHFLTKSLITDYDEIPDGSREKHKFSLFKGKLRNRS